MILTPTSAFNRRSGHIYGMQRELTAIQQALGPEMDLEVMCADALPLTHEILNLRQRAIETRGMLSPKNQGALEHAKQERARFLHSHLLGRYEDPKLVKLMLKRMIASDDYLIDNRCFHNTRYKLARSTESRGKLDMTLPEVQPTMAFIMLSPACFDSVAQLAYNTALPVQDAEHSKPFAPHISDLWHEAGHLKLIRTGQATIPWHEERYADHSAQQRRYELGQQPLAARYQLTRTLLNFLGSINYPGSSYWNVLSQFDLTPNTLHGVHIDKAATLELKHRAASWMQTKMPLPPVAAEPAQQVEACIDYSTYMPVRAHFDGRGFLTQAHTRALLRSLYRVEAHGRFTYPETRVLTELTIAAAENLLPNVMRVPGGKALRNKPQAV